MRLYLRKKTGAMEENENISPVSRRQAVAERLRKKYPEDNYEDDEVLWGRVDDDFNDYESRIGDYRQREDELMNLFNKDPRSASFISSMARGEDPLVMLVRELGVDGLSDLVEDPARQEELAAANKEYLERMSRDKSLEEEYQANMRDSLGNIEALQQERGLTDEQIDAAADLLLKIANEVIVGKFSRENLDMALKALNFDGAVAEAEQNGEVRGRNARIEEKWRKPHEGDGLPTIGGQNGGEVEGRRRGGFFAALEEL